MSEKRTLSRWLRSGEVYHEKDVPATTRHWRDGLLGEFEHGPLVERPRWPEDVRSPLQWHHLALMAPAGVTLFGLGWLLGSGAAVVDQLAGVSPLVWVVCSLAASAGFWVWRNQGSSGQRDASQRR